MARGQHISVRSSSRGLRYHHHGIDMGDGTVIHLAPSSGARFTLRNDSDEFTVRRDSREDFAAGQPVFVVEHSVEREPEEVAQTAQSMLGRAGYSLLDGNCEHFATLCATGLKGSQQVDFGVATVTALTSMATKAAWSISSKAAARIALKGATKLHPAAMLADGVEVFALTVGHRQGLSVQRTQRIARLSGNVAAAGIGGLVGGPAGAAVCLAAHSSSNAIADSVCKTVRKWLS